MLGRQAALIYAMVAAARADREITTAEIAIIGDLVNHLPIFDGIDRRRVSEIAAACSTRLARAEDVDQVYAQIREALSPSLREAAYALSCDVIAAGGRVQHEQMEARERVLAELEVDPANARVIERLARLRCQAA
jgi:uncharacterized membrane protein YebE (DUF533 family)